jgi:FkbM family methyltransferase
MDPDMAGPHSRTKEFLRGLVPAAAQLPAYNALLNLKRRRRGTGQGPIRVTAAGLAFDVAVDGDTIRIPTLRRSQRYASGIASKEAALARKYGCPTFYQPQPGDVIIDIGANVGEFARYCGALGARVLAFEPDPSVYACLKHNVAKYAAVTPIEKALWSTHADLPFFSAFDTADSSLIQPEANVRGVATIAAIPLDGVTELHNVPEIALLKMDGEGAEPEILQGATETLARIRRVAVDCSPERAGDDTAAPVKALLMAAGYEIVSPPEAKLVFAIRA